MHEISVVLTFQPITTQQTTKRNTKFIFFPNVIIMIINPLCQCVKQLWPNSEMNLVLCSTTRATQLPIQLCVRTNRGSFYSSIPHSLLPHPARNDDTSNYNYIHCTCTVVSWARHLISSANTDCAGVICVLLDVIPEVCIELSHPTARELTSDWVGSFKISVYKNFWLNF